MPTYQYACAKCGHEFEIFQSMKDPALEICPKDRCGRQRWGRGKVKRLMGAGAGLIFKGSGFYTTDYRSESYKAGAKSDASSGSTSATPSTPSTPSTSSPASGTSPTPKKDAGAGGSPGKSAGSSGKSTPSKSA